jgi:hypothetical protein
VKKEQIWSLIAQNGAMHRCVSTINHPVSELAGAAF